MTKSALTIECGTLVWRNEKRLYHRDNDKPAVIDQSGTKIWYVNGKIHRGNGKPAIIRPDNYNAWYVKGKFIKQVYTGK